MKIEKFYIWIVLFFVVVSQTKAEVVPSILYEGKGVEINNFTNTKWIMGGVRFRNNGFKWTRIDGDDNLYTINNNDNNEVELYRKTTSVSSYTTIKPEEAWFFNHSGTTESGTEVIPGSIELLLKTGIADMTDQIIGEAPITLSDISNIITKPNFYDENYRSVDSLGIRGGAHAAGIHDTWKGETQIQLGIPTDSITINAEKVIIDSALNHFWMALAIAQEFFNADAQYFAAVAMRESNLGISAQTFEPDTESGVFTHWDLEPPTGLDRAFLYPQLFPKYEAALTKANNITLSGINSQEFMTYYTLGNLDKTPENSALVLNGLLLSYVVNLVNHKIYSYASDICWKEALETAIDPYIGPTMLLPAYHNGMGGAIYSISTPLSQANLDATCNNPYTINLFPDHNTNYSRQVLSIIKKLEEASKELQTTPSTTSATFVDPHLTKNEVLNMFFGDNGTVSNQGNGGLLLHFYDPSVADYTSIRQKIWDTLSSAFNALQGKSPNSEAERISFRYDFLTLLRTVKEFFPLEHHFIICGDTEMHVSRYSEIGGCNSFENDTLYPRAEIVGSPIHNTDFITEIRGTDDLGVKQVTWTIDSQWGTWYNASYKSGSGIDQIFSITVPQSLLSKTLGNKDGTLWYMVTDETGHSVVKTIPITNSDENKKPTDISLSITSIPTTQSSGSSFAKITSVDPNFGDTESYEVTTPSSPFIISGIDSLGLAGDCPAEGNHDVTIKVTDGGGLSYSELFTIKVTPVTPTEYTLTVTKGTGDGDYKQGATANITAEAPKKGYEFDHWSDALKCINDTTKPITTLTMPGQDLTVEALFKRKFLDLTVTNGSGGGKCAYDSTVTITAEDSSHHTFSHWSGDTDYVATTTEKQTTVKMPDQNVSVTANYNAIEYALSVTDGDGDGDYAAKTQVPVKAMDSTGFTFSRWSGDAVTFKHGGLKIDTLTMPGKITEIKAEYNADNIPTFTLTVNDAKGDRTHELKESDTLTVEARSKDDSANVQFQFDSWSDPTSVLSNTTTAKALATMKKSEATVTAKYSVFNYTVTDFKLTSNSIKGDAPLGSPIADFTVSDADSDEIHTFEIIGSSNDFKIIENKLQSKRIFNASEFNNTLDVSIKCSDKGSSLEKTLKVQILNPDLKTANLRVENGLDTTTTSYNVGSTIDISADNLSGKQFDTWQGTTSAIVVGSITDKDISVKIPETDITLTATYTEQEFYSLIVNNGSGSKEQAIAGEEIEVSAQVPTGYTFTSWSGDTDNFKHNGTETDTILMPAKDINITAHFIKNEGSHSLLDKLLEDKIIDGEDFVYVSQEWNKYQQNSLDDLLELAPYTGQRPTITVTPNQTFDHYDLSSFTALCYYYSNLQLAPRLNKQKSEGLPVLLKPHWIGDSLAITLSVDSITDLLSCSFEVSSDIQKIVAGPLLQKDAEPYSVITQNRSTITRLTSGTLGTSGSGAVAFAIVQPDADDSTISLAYTLRNSQAKIISRGEKCITIPRKASSQISISVTPTPCNISEGEELTFRVNATESAQTKDLTVSLSVLDNIGDVLFENTKQLKGYSGTIEWDGITNKGILPSSGTYKAFIKCYNDIISETKELLIGIEE